MEINDLIPVRSSLIGWSSLGREHLVLNLRSGEHASLDWFPGEVWKLCDGIRTVGQIIQHLEGASSLEPGEARREILEILGRFSRDELIAFSGKVRNSSRVPGEDKERQDEVCRS
jgi:hypothetical protein